VDVWPLDSSMTENHIQVTEGDELFVALPENRTTGYCWVTDDEIRARGERAVASAPAPFGQDYELPHPIREPTEIPVRGRSAASIKRALARVPGDAGARRVLPGQQAGSEGEPGIETTDYVNQGSRWNTSAAAVQPPDLQVVEDRYEAGWATVPPSAIRNVRRAIAGRHDLALPEAIHTYLSSQAPGERGAASLGTGAIPVAATGYRLIALRSLGEGTQAFGLSYTSAFDPQAPTVESYHVEVVVSPTPQVQRRRKLLQIDFENDAPGGWEQS
jgi:predicted secreted protein